MSNWKENRWKIAGCIIVIIALFFTGKWLWENQKVQFEDEKMRQIICLELGKDKDSQDITYKDLEKIQELEIGPVGNFETVEDIAKCKNLKQLWINIEVTEKSASYKVYKKTIEGKIYLPILKEKQVERICKDLNKIFKTVKGIECFGFTNFNESCNIKDLNFLIYAKNLKKITISFVTVDDYSVLEDCDKLEVVYLWDSNIETADSLLKLKNVKKFWLTGTPLAENEKEIKRLKEAFPEAEIIVD